MTSTDNLSNTIINEIDSGLRSASVSDRCVAIEKVRNIFERSPFPIYVNAVCLRLADAFSAATSSNFIRYQIVAVLDAHRAHLSKVINVDELERRVLTVTHSNDTIARCVALLFIAAFARAFRHSAKVHHRVLNALDARDGPVELNAALFATRRFLASRCATSFADAACRKLVALVHDGASSAPQVRRRVATLFRFFRDSLAADAYHALSDAAQASANDALFVAAALSSLTALAVQSRCVAPQTHVAMLAERARKDRRTPVQREALSGLHWAASTMPHTFDDSHVTALLALVDDPDASLRLGAMYVLETLLRNQVTALCTLSASTRAKLHQVADSLISGALKNIGNRDSLLIGTTAAAIRLHLHAAEAQVRDDDAMTFLGLLARATESDARVTLSDSRTWLAVQRRIDTALLVYSPCWSIGVAERLVAAMKVSTDSASFLDSTLTFICGVMHRFCFVDVDATRISYTHGRLVDDLLDLADRDADERTLLRCCTLLLIVAQRQDVRGRALSAFRRLICDAKTPCSSMTRFRLARSAMRYAQFAVAIELLDDVFCVSSATTTEWFYVLRCAVAAELELETERSGYSFDDCDTLLDQLDARRWLLAAQHARNAHQHLVALLAFAKDDGRGNCPLAPSQTAFQHDFVRLRAAQLEAYATLVQLFGSHRRVVLSMLRGGQVEMDGGEALRERAERFLRMQLRALVVRLRSIRDSLRSVARRCYDADTSTLRCVEGQAYQCEVVESLLGSLFCGDRNSCEITKLRLASLRLDNLLPTCASLHGRLRELQKRFTVEPDDPRAIFSALIEVLMCTMRFPHYFFAARKQTTVQLIVTPSSSAASSSSASSEPIAVIPAGTVLSLKLECTINTQLFDKRRSTNSAHARYGRSNLLAHGDEDVLDEEESNQQEVVGEGSEELDKSSDCGPRRCRVRVFVTHSDYIGDTEAQLETADNVGEANDAAASMHERVVAVRNDYLSAAFLISLVRSGKHRLRFAIDLLDANSDRVWHLKALDCASLNLHSAHVVVHDTSGFVQDS